MEGLYEWVRNIAYYLIFITVVSSLLPNSKYEKYMKLFAGMVCILLVLKPLTSGLRLDDKLAYYFEAISFQKESDDLKSQLSGMETERLHSMVGQYEEAIAVDLERMVRDEGLYQSAIRVTIDDSQESDSFGSVTGVWILLTDTPPQEEEDSLGIRPVEPVVIAPEQEKENTHVNRQKENAAIQSLRTRIAEYYGLEAQKVEIQLEHGEDGER